MRLFKFTIGLGVAIIMMAVDQGNGAPPPREPADQGNKPICELENTLHRSVKPALFLPRTDRLVLGGGYWLGPGELTFCETTTLKSLMVCKDHSRQLWSLAASPDGSKIATGGGFGEVKVYDAASGKVLAHLDAGGEYTYAVAFSSDGRLLANAAGHAVKLWDMKTMKESVSVPGVITSPSGLAFTPDDKLLAYGDDDEIHFWDVRKGQEAFKVPYRNICTLLFTPDGKGLIVGGVDGDDPSSIRFWDLEKKKETRVFKGHKSPSEGNPGAVVALTLDRQGKYLISGSGDQTVRIWDLATGKEIACLAGNKAIVRGLAVSSGNKYLVTCSDELIRVWDLQKLLKKAEREKGSGVVLRP